MSVCRSCGAKILWIEMRSGKKMPVDPEILSSDDCEHGDLLITITGKSLRVDHSTPDYISVEGYLSHFATCPDPGAHRRK